jgi:phenylacetate-CoA ligase
MLVRTLLRNVFFPITEQLTRTRFWSNYQESLRFDELEEPHRRTVRNRRLSRVLNQALDSSLHRQRLQEAGLRPGRVNPDDAGVILTRFRPLTKAEIRRHFPAGATTCSNPEDWRYLSTAGTTDRMTVVADFVKRDHCRSSELHALWLTAGADVAVKSVDIPPDACSILCGLKDAGPPTLLGYLWYCLRKGTIFSPQSRSDLRGRFERRVVFQRQTLPPIDPAPGPQLREVLDAYLEQIARSQPAVLRGFPIYLLWLADRCRARGPALPRLRVINPYGGLTSPQMVARITAGLGARFANMYGTSELGAVAASCGRSPGMHLFEDLFWVDVLRCQEPVAPGEVGRLVITDLVNTAMPMIRYDVGDVGRLHLDPCPCGRKTARLEVLGRVEEVIAAPIRSPLRGGDGGGAILTSSAVADTFFADPAVANFRLEEVAAGSFEAAVVAGPSSAPDLRAWEDRFAALHPGIRKLRARLVPFVRPEASGKYRFVRPLQTENVL